MVRTYNFYKMLSISFMCMAILVSVINTIHYFTTMNIMQGIIWILISLIISIYTYIKYFKK